MNMKKIVRGNEPLICLSIASCGASARSPNQLPKNVNIVLEYSHVVRISVEGNHNPARPSRQILQGAACVHFYCLMDSSYQLLQSPSYMYILLIQNKRVSLYEGTTT